jgi:signal transduction histidine kinase
MRLHFDDTLDTVLATAFSSAFEKQSAFRQLADLIGRRRVPADARAIEALSRLIPDVPVGIRTAAARGLAFANPPAPLVALFATDVLAVAAPVLRTAMLSDDDWCELLPRLAPPCRSILRHRRDLSSAVERALASFGPVDFVLSADRGVSPLLVSPVDDPVPAGPFQIAEVVARIDAAREQRERGGDAPGLASSKSDDDRFRFETDASGVVRYADGIARAPMVGLSLRLAGKVGTARIDAVAAGAFRQRSRFRDARLGIDGDGPACGIWLLSATPLFDPASGRFTGYRGTARRPRADEVAEPGAARTARADAYRQLVHELRTPTNAIVGFSEMIEHQILGPVADPYRNRASAMRHSARDLLGAIDDLDLAARIDSDTLTLRPEPVSLRAVIAVVADDLRPLAELRAAAIGIPDRDVAVQGDRHAIERLIGRLAATLLSATRAGEDVAMTLAEDGDSLVALTVTRPAALTIDTSLTGEDMDDDDSLRTVPLGTGFALRLVGNLARELGGSLIHDEKQLVLRLPAAQADERQRARNY